jgi:hypothetical protein
MRGHIHLSLSLGAAILAACAPDNVSTPTDDSPGLEPVPETVLPVIRSARVASSDFPGLPEAAQKFQITLRFINTPTADQLAVFEEAASRWQGLIHGDVPEIVGTIPANGCGPGFPLPPFTGVIDDIMINVLLQRIDGPGAILGAAGACFVRTTDGLPLYGLMFFDTDDLAFLELNNVLGAVIQHEMGHVLGFSGGIFNLNIPGVFQRNLLANPNTPSPQFLGSLARAKYITLGGEGATVPIEGTPCGAGTRNSHWDEATFFNELMTGFLNTASANFYNPLSRMTSAAMHDLGYKAVPKGQDYDLRPAFVDPCPQPPTTATAAAEGIDIGSREIIIEPVGLVGE